MASVRLSCSFLALLVALPHAAMAERYPYQRVQELNRRKGYTNDYNSDPYGMPNTIYSSGNNRERANTEAFENAEKELMKAQQPAPQPSLSREDIEAIIDKKLGKPSKAEIAAKEEAAAKAKEAKAANENFGPVGGLGTVGGIGGTGGTGATTTTQDGEGTDVTP